MVISMIYNACNTVEVQVNKYPPKKMLTLIVPKPFLFDFRWLPNFT